MTHPVVAFAGMTHLGLVSATAVASAGFETVCFDNDPALIACLRKGDLPVVEPDLPNCSSPMAAVNGLRHRIRTWAIATSSMSHPIFLPTTKAAAIPRR